MAGFPSIFAQHEFKVRAVAGHDGYGRAIYAPEVTARGLVQEGRKQTTVDGGRTATAEAVILCPLDVVVTMGTLITLPSLRVAEVINVKRIDGGSLPVPSHQEVYTT